MKINPRLRKFYDGLNYNNFRKGLNYSKKIISGIKDVNELSKKYNIDSVSRLTDKVIQNDKFKKFESGINTIDNLDKVYSHTKGLKINNIVPRKSIDYDKLNQDGILHARNRHNEEMKRITRENLN